MSQVRERVPPQNLEAEQAVIGSMLIEANAVVSALEILRPEDFYKESHRIIFKQIAEMADRLEAVDVVTVAENLRNAGYLDKIGGTAELARLANFVPTAANVEYYAKIVAEKAILRRLIAASTEIAATAYDSQYEVDEILDKAEETIFQISQRRATQGYVHLKDVLVETMEKLEYLASHKGNVVGLSSGFSDLDYLTSGFQPSDLIILAARPAVGKTSLGLNIARNVAIREDCPVAIFSLEMSREQVAQRLLCSEAAINSQKLRSGFLTDDEWRRLSIALGRLSEAKIFIDDTPGISVMEVRAKARRIKAEHGLGLVVVDYLQLMRTRKQENRQQEISEAAEIRIKYKGYIEREVIVADKMHRLEDIKIKGHFSYSELKEISTEGRQKLERID
ncbi:MAG TPA: replicative DNA helicase, partial [Firmicutes bacterium]|nr:replicative DNA helicase [Candidatus Fermentithermobacillaceae bacterium]